jgi:hypothetical protein
VESSMRLSLPLSVVTVFRIMARAPSKTQPR